MKISTGVSMTINAPEFFKDPAFIGWLNNGERKFTWHQGHMPDEWSDVVVLVDPGLTGEGSDSEIDLAPVFPDPSYSQRNAASLTGERRAWAA
jgi:hypothetical protein